MAPPYGPSHQRVRMEVGMQRAVIRLTALHPIFASARGLGRVRAWSRRPVSRPRAVRRNDRPCGSASLAWTQPRHRTRRSRQRRPTGDRPGADPGVLVVGDAREQAA
jgi:hypothetical protein